MVHVLHLFQCLKLTPMVVDYSMAIFLVNPECNLTLDLIPLDNFLHSTTAFYPQALMIERAQLARFKSREVRDVTLKMTSRREPLLDRRD